MQNNMFLISVGVLFIGFIFLGLSSFVYKWRAFTNRRPWNGSTVPIFIIGIIFFAIGLMLVYAFYPYR